MTTQLEKPTITTDGAQLVTTSFRFGEIAKRQEVTLVGVIIAFAIVIGVLNPVFFSSGNIINLLSSTVVYFVLACGSRSSSSPAGSTSRSVRPSPSGRSAPPGSCRSASSGRSQC
ncbi:hypothetical protein AX769_00940 [Frondihabitans sp. PAMC 28766]|uniref:hypothetical protein n=1 Tax=Frondihabitans sp. PAMC 28766 TaxID=1795630 RepID=UPI00078C8A0C|nr:hypothetical protein [Frondihabitans sp. PAMC 28766]AMM18963.1 hypothetical protein AX769_00940 [Frondihabitans sp. PAMC 28766]